MAAISPVAFSPFATLRNVSAQATTGQTDWIDVPNWVKSILVTLNITANAGTTLNTSALATEAGAVSSAAASLRVMDDWDNGASDGVSGDSVVKNLFWGMMGFDPSFRILVGGGSMAYEFKFPDIGEGLTEGEIVRWLVTEGDTLKEGSPLVEVETDKALAEIPSPKTGVVLKILAREKEIVKVGQVIVVLGEKGETPAVAAPKPASVGVVGELEEAHEEIPAAAATAEPQKPLLVSAHALAAPAVRALAKELGVEID